MQKDMRIVRSKTADEALIQLFAERKKLIRLLAERARLIRQLAKEEARHEASIKARKSRSRSDASVRK